MLVTMMVLNDMALMLLNWLLNSMSNNPMIILVVRLLVVARVRMVMLIRRLLDNLILDRNVLMLLNIFMVGMMWNISIKCPLDSVLMEVNRLNIVLIVVLMVQLMVHLFMLLVAIVMV